MRSARLSVKLGFTVTAMSAVLGLAMAAFALAAISRQLDIQARDGLTDKLGQIEHSLAEGSASIADIVLHPHNLRDQIVGHDNLTLTIMDSSIPRKRLLVLGANEGAELLVPKPKSSSLEFEAVNSAEGYETLMAYKLIRLMASAFITDARCFTNAAMIRSRANLYRPHCLTSDHRRSVMLSA